MWDLKCFHRAANHRRHRAFVKLQLLKFACLSIPISFHQEWLDCGHSVFSIQQLNKSKILPNRSIDNQQIWKFKRTTAEFGIFEQRFVMHRWPKSIEMACNDFESTGTTISGALMRTFNSMRLAFEYASTIFCLAVSAAAALASAIACCAAWKLSRKFYSSKEIRIFHTHPHAKNVRFFSKECPFSTYQHRIHEPIQENDFYTAHRYIDFHVIIVINWCLFQIK